MHYTLDVCDQSGMLATGFCPAHSRKGVIAKSLAHDPGVREIIELLEHACKEQGPVKGQYKLSRTALCKIHDLFFLILYCNRTHFIPSHEMFSEY